MGHERKSEWHTLQRVIRVVSRLHSGTASPNELIQVIADFDDSHNEPTEMLRDRLEKDLRRARQGLGVKIDYWRRENQYVLTGLGALAPLSQPFRPVTKPQRLRRIRAKKEHQRVNQMPLRAKWVAWVEQQGVFMPPLAIADAEYDISRLMQTGVSFNSALWLWWKAGYQAVRPITPCVCECCSQEYIDWANSQRLYCSEDCKIVEKRRRLKEG